MLKICGCMNPRLIIQPMQICADWKSVKQTVKAEKPFTIGLCLEETSQHLGDPSKWKECICPPPCVDEVYLVDWSTAPFASNVRFDSCNVPPLKHENCLSLATVEDVQNCDGVLKEDSALIRVNLPRLETSTLRETPAMDVSARNTIKSTLSSQNSSLSSEVLSQFSWASHSSPLLN